MSDQQPDPDTRWQWDASQWGDSPTAPTSPGQVPDPDATPEHWSPAVRRLLRWAAR